jgi:hypothetical protein
LPSQSGWGGKEKRERKKNKKYKEGVILKGRKQQQGGVWSYGPQRKSIKAIPQILNYWLFH